ncbi:MAG TPA: hypothetical protein VFS66_14320 [Acidimicrobiia bacterium]|nr:hypothetical protein [Acidimicrobiia bacterium]
MDQATQSDLRRAPTPISDSEAQRAFNWAIVISGIRCLIAYILLPFVIPIIGIAEGVGPWLGVAIGVVAIVANVFSIRRFARSSHRLRTPVIAINCIVIALLLVMMAIDVNAIVSGSV